MNSYWDGAGKYQSIISQLSNLIPNEGVSENSKLEMLRICSNTYYDFYNNGLGNWGNKKDEFENLSIGMLSASGIKAFYDILKVLPSDGDTLDCGECDGSGEIEYEEEVFYHGMDGQEVDYETSYETCYNCDGQGEYDWENNFSGLDDNEFDKLEPLFETLVDSVVEYIILK